ncbi:hypothetical protein HY932_02255, partial [Candidatus Falkowbacteria bacterium]|nr:hypothetical protein [Candidatus Falkowbacteria bacterium]
EIGRGDRFCRHCGRGIEFDPEIEKQSLRRLQQEREKRVREEEARRRSGLCQCDCGRECATKKYFERRDKARHFVETYVPFNGQWL